MRRRARRIVVEVDAQGRGEVAAAVGERAAERAEGAGMRRDDDGGQA
jgi:hypothetical protein